MLEQLITEFLKELIKKFRKESSKEKGNDKRKFLLEISHGSLEKFFKKSLQKYLQRPPRNRWKSLMEFRLSDGLMKFYKVAVEKFLMEEVFREFSFDFPNIFTMERLQFLREFLADFP